MLAAAGLGFNSTQVPLSGPARRFAGRITQSASKTCVEYGKAGRFGDLQWFVVAPRLLSVGRLGNVAHGTLRVALTHLSQDCP